MHIDSEFAGGNIIADRIEGDNAYIRQDLRDTEGDWFYWCFRVRGAAGRTLTFRFTGSPVLTSLGPAVSKDEGKTWRWLGQDPFDGTGFVYAFGPEEQDVRFGLAPAYTLEHWSAFVDGHRGNPCLKDDGLAETRRGRAVPLARAGCLDGNAKHRIVLTCRHHACEMMADYVLEGILQTVLSETALGKWFQSSVEVLAVPFVDLDGVEEGDQGKNRRPHDHGRDYGEKTIYPTPAALKEYIPKWSDGKLRIALDLHCPMHRWPEQEEILLVAPSGEANLERLRRFAQILEREQTGPLHYSAERVLPHGTSWNVSSLPLLSFGGWVVQQPDVRVAATVETPYALAAGREVNADSAREFGRDLAAAMAEYLGTTLG
jgi:hypothetical protein